MTYKEAVGFIGARVRWETNAKVGDVNDAIPSGGTHPALVFDVNDHEIVLDVSSPIVGWKPDGRLFIPLERMVSMERAS